LLQRRVNRVPEAARGQLQGRRQDGCAVCSSVFRAVLLSHARSAS
jgi:hypothetical protein